MNITHIYLFKVPFDSDYKKVIDIINYPNELTVRTLFEHYKDYYTQMEITNKLPYSVKRINSETVIFVGERYSNIRDFNYAVIDYNDSHCEYYFINSIISENDSDNKPSSSIILKWDAWSNNYHKFENSKDKNIISISHFKRYDFEKDGNEIVSFTPKFYDVFNSKTVPHFYSNVTKRVDNYLTGLIPAFYKITFTDFYDEDGVDHSILEGQGDLGDGYVGYFKVRDSVQGLYNRNVVYYYAGLFDQLQGTFIEHRLYSNFTIMIEGGSESEYRNYSRYFNIGNGIVKLNIPPKSSPYLANVEMTFHSPFKYTITKDTNDKNVIQFGNLYVVPVSGNAMVAITGSMNVSSNMLIDTVLNNVYLTEYEFQTEIEINPKDYFTQNGIFSNNTSALLGVTETIEPIAYTNPIHSLSIMFNKTELHIEPIGGKYRTIKIRIYKNTFQPIIKIFYISSSGEEVLLYNYNYPSIQSSGNFPISKNALADYEIRNGTQNENTVVNSLLKNTVSFLVQGATVGSLLSTTTDFLSTSMTVNAKLSDMANTPSMFYPSSGDVDIYFQDRLYIKQVNSFYRDIPNYIRVYTPEIKVFLDKIYMYGYKFDKIGSVFENTRCEYDFCKTENCILSNDNLNYEDKLELSRMFNNGVFKCHILYKNDKITVDNRQCLIGVTGFKNGFVLTNNCEIDILMSQIYL